MAKIIRPELIKRISRKIDYRVNQEDIYWVLQGLYQCYEDILREGDTLVVGNYFSLKPVLKKERLTGNFGKGKMNVPAHWEPQFKPYSKLRKACADLPIEDENTKKAIKGKRKKNG